MINCEIFMFDESNHTEQIYTGLSILHHNRVINANIAKKTSRLINIPVVKIRINNKINIIYDLADSQKLILPNKEFNNTNFYFKRSFKKDANYNHNNTFLHPLGFNYCVYSLYQYFLHDRMIQIPNVMNKINFIIRQNRFLCNVFNINNGVCNCSDERIKQEPIFPEHQSIIFMTRTWPESRAKTEEKKEHRYEINNMRANCIRSLKNNYGPYFYGGFYNDEYTKKNFPDCVLTNNRFTDKKYYFPLVKKSPICIATTGLEYSTGWKMGEYIAFSRAIVSETLHNIVPGNYQEGKHYFEFTSADQCIKKVEKLFSDKALCFETMKNNHQYYQDFLRPDKLVWNTLNIAMQSIDK